MSVKSVGRSSLVNILAEIMFKVKVQGQVFPGSKEWTFSDKCILSECHHVDGAFEFLFVFSFLSVRSSPDKGVHVDGSGTGHTDLVGCCSLKQHLRQFC